MYGPVEYIYKDGRIGSRRIQCQLPTGMIKKVIQQGRASLVASRRGQPLFDARSVLLVREHGKMATCLREAGTAKAGNAASPVPS